MSLRSFITIVDILAFLSFFFISQFGGVLLIVLIVIPCEIANLILKQMAKKDKIQLNSNGGVTK